MIPVGASGGSAPLPFSLFNDTTGDAITGYTFVAGDLKVRLPGGTWENATLTNVYEWGLGQYELRLTAAQTAAKGAVGIRALTSASSLDVRFERIGEIDRRSSGNESELPFTLYDESTGLAITGHSFVDAGGGLTSDVKVYTPGESWTNATTANIVEWGLGQYGLKLSSAETADDGVVAVRAKSAASALHVSYGIVGTEIYPGALGASTTAASIRDRIKALIQALTPTSDAGVKFRSYRNEDGADFQDWAEKNPAAALRRFQARDDGSEEPPEVSDTLVDMRHVTFLILVAYPHTGRHGADQALDRDDVIDQDWGLINGKVGIYGRAQYSGAYDCTPLGATREIIRGAGVDFLEVRARFSYYRAVT